MILIKKNFFYYQTKAFEQYHVKQTKFRLSKRSNNHPHGTYGHWLSTCTSSVCLGLFIMTSWLSAFWYFNPVFTSTCSIVLPYGILQSNPAKIYISLLKSISHWPKFYLEFFQKWFILGKQLLLSLIFPSPIFHCLSLSLFNCSQLFIFRALNSFPLS